MLTLEEVKYYNKMIKESKSVLDKLNIEYARNIDWDTFRRSRTWGLCINKHDGTYNIKLTEALIRSKNDHSVCDTIIHELLHTCKGCHGHGGEWLRLAKLVNSKTDYNIKRLTSAEEKGIKREYKYKVICEGCGSVSYYYSKNRFIKNEGSGYRCKCGCKSWATYNKDNKLVWESHTIEDMLHKKLKFSAI